MKSSVTLIAAGLSIVLATLASAQTPTPTPGFPPLSQVPHTTPFQDQPNATRFCFIAAGDNRPKHPSDPPTETLKHIFKDAHQFAPAFFIWAGDIIYGHKDDPKMLKNQYAQFFDFAAKAGAPIFNAPGNHEMDTFQSNGSETPDAGLHAQYLANMQMPAGGPAYGAFNYGNSRFIALDTEEVASPTPTPSATATAAAPSGGQTSLDPGYVSPTQFQLLTADLQANTSKAHIFVFMHHPIMPAKSSSGLNAANAQQLQQLFAQYPNVSYVIAAHEHLYYNATGTSEALADRIDPSSNGPSYVVTGGAGARLENSCPSQAGSRCGLFHHYLVFEVNDKTVKAKVVKVTDS
jgi:Calcineurin-like phosphoesterase